MNTKTTNIYTLFETLFKKLSQKSFPINNKLFKTKYHESHIEANDPIAITAIDAPAISTACNRLPATCMNNTGQEYGKPTTTAIPRQRNSIRWTTAKNYPVKPTSAGRYTGIRT